MIKLFCLILKQLKLTKVHHICYLHTAIESSMFPLFYFHNFQNDVVIFLKIEKLISVPNLIRAYLVEKNSWINSRTYMFIRDCRVGRIGKS